MPLPSSVPRSPADALRAPFTFDDAVYYVGAQLNAAYSDRALLDVRYNAFMLPVPAVPTRLLDDASARRGGTRRTRTPRLT